jgi:hypothetical protein
MGTNVFKSIGRCRVLEVLGTAGLVLAGLAWAAACRSPASAQPPENILRYAYGLIDDFESGAVSASRWYSETLNATTIKVDKTGNHYAQIGLSFLQVEDTGPVYPDVFDRMSVRVLIPSDQDPSRNSPVLIYTGWISLVPITFVVRIGIRPDAMGNHRFFADWFRYIVGDSWRIDGPTASLDEWHTIELEIAAESNSEIRLIFRADGQVFGDSVPPFGSDLLDRTKLSNLRRKLSIAADESRGDSPYAIMGCFDDVWGTIGSVSPGTGSFSIHAMPLPIEFWGPPMDAQRPQHFPGPNRDGSRAMEAAPAREKQ